jgi:hypothetical protein
MGLALSGPVPFRLWVGRTLVAVALALMAIASVGLTAAPDAPFSIAIQPVFLRLGVDVDIKVGSAHLHAGWSALPD